MRAVELFDPSKDRDFSPYARRQIEDAIASGSAEHGSTGSIVSGLQRPGAATPEPATAAERSTMVAIGVGLHPGYNAAQVLYAKRGYVPDGLGVTGGTVRPGG